METDANHRLRRNRKGKSDWIHRTRDRWVKGLNGEYSDAIRKWRKGKSRHNGKA